MTTNTIPIGRDPAPPPELVFFTSGNEFTRDQFAPPSVLCHKPLAREPKNSTRPSFGSTASRSPLLRPSSLPPIFSGSSAFFHVLPRSSERKTAALPLAHSLVYVPQAMKTL